MMTSLNLTIRCRKALACAIMVLGAATLPAEAAAPAHGKYACLSSKYKAATGTYEFTARGAFTLSANSQYSYLGFEQPSRGTFKVDQASGTLTFAGGYLDKGAATPIKGDANRYYLVSPSLPEHRWTCSLK